MKYLRHLLVFIFAFYAINAQCFEVNGITYSITDTAAKTVSVIKNYSNENVGDIVIPETVTYNQISYRVTSIGSSAFYSCTGLTSIEIPSSVTSIGEYAFYGCTGLKGVHISDIAAWCGMDFSSSNSNPLGYAENLYLNGELITELVIPNSVTSIGNYTFNGCTSLKNVRFEDGEGVLTLGYNGSYEGLFYDCPLETLYIGRELSYATDAGCGYSPFYNKSTLTSVIIGDNVTGIGDYAFRNCSGLTSVTIPNSVTSIGSSAFYGCTGLTSVTIGNSVTNIGERAFYGCTELMTVINFSNLTFIESNDNGYVAYYADNFINAPNGSFVGDFVFGEIESKKTLVRYIGNETEIILPDRYKDENYTIGRYAFSDCSNITSILLSNSITEIGAGAFSGCDNITSLTIPNSVTQIWGMAFLGCTSLKHLYMEDGTEDLNITSNVYDGLFNDCPIETLYLGRNLYASKAPFDNETCSLKSIIIGDCVTSINDYIFYGCKGITDLIIPENVKNIGFYAFFGCDGLSRIICKPTVPPTLASVVFSNKSTPIYVASKSVNTYKNTPGWDFFTNIEEIKYRVTYIVNDEIYTTRDIAFGAKIPTDIKEGYTFVCNNMPTSMPAEDITITGSFSVNNYTITYIVDGEEYKTETVEYGTTITLIDEPTKEGHTFSGWSEISSTMPAEDITITGSFSVNSYTITYIVDGEEYKTETVEYGTTITLIDEPTKEGHTFSGWSEILSTMPAEDITITGSFSVNSYTITYIVDGEEYKTETVEYGTTITLIDEPTKEGHTFSGWSEIPSTMPAEDITVSSTFTANDYVVTYIVDGEVYKTDSVTYGTEIVLIDEPVKEGHTFSGWSEAPATMPAEDIAIAGTFLVNSYNVTFTVDGEVYQSISVEYGAEIPTVETPIKEGRKFSGWSEIPSTMPAKNVNIEGGFCYTIIFMLDGKYYYSSEIYYGTVIKAPAEPPHREGHTFVEWGNLPETMPARDMTIHAIYSVNKYQLIFIIDGQVYETLYIEYGSKIEYPQIEGYIITWETETLPETMPAENLIIIGTSTLDTAIKGIHEVHSDYIIYTLDGHRVLDIENLRSGFYIINGKKVFVK